MWEKLKSFLADDAIFYSVLILLIGVISFGLGRQSVLERQSDNNIVESAGVVFSQLKDEVPTEVLSIEVVASKSGTKYHLLDCPGAKQIKDTNKVYFKSIDLAEAAGYTPAGNCPELSL